MGNKGGNKKRDVGAAFIYCLPLFAGDHSAVFINIGFGSCLQHFLFFNCVTTGQLLSFSDVQFPHL